MVLGLSNSLGSVINWGWDYVALWIVLHVACVVEVRVVYMGAGLVVLGWVSQMALHKWMGGHVYCALLLQKNCGSSFGA